jgi:hypothetical protein
MAVKEKNIKKAIIESKGILSVAASKMGITRATLYKRIKKHEGLQDVVNEARETLKDFAESKLLSNMNEGKEASIFFFLKTQAKDRGYVERQEISGPDSGPVEINVTLDGYQENQD